MLYQIKKNIVGAIKFPSKLAFFLFIVGGFFFITSSSFAKNQFQDYWYSGKAEITLFELKQARYGEIHSGKLFLIFVTEDFLQDKQVKNESNQSRSIPILKLNLLKKFPTGIYDYSTMTSIFTPIQTKKHPSTLKITMSSQEWCGHVYTQVNLKSFRYQVKSHSYFEKEADEEYYLPKILFEDEILNKIRLSPKSLPIGNIFIVPNILDSRLRHYNLKRENAIAIHNMGEVYNTYIIKYKKISRKLIVQYKKTFPYEILKIEEHLGSSTNQVTTTNKVKTIKVDYWNKNKIKDMELFFK